MKQRKMNTQEFVALREEINTRLSSVVSLNDTVLVVVGALWLVHFTIMKQDMYPILLWIAMFVILSTTALHIQNNRQISVLASYLMVFYEYPTLKNQNRALLCWEYCQRHTNLLAGKGVGNYLVRLLYHAVYPGLAIADVVIYWMERNNCHYPEWQFWLPFAMVAVIGFLVVVLILRGSKLFTPSRRKEDARTLMKLANELGVISDIDEHQEIIDLFFGKKS